MENDGTMKSSMKESLQSRLNRARDALAACDLLLIGAGAGLSGAAGLTYDGQRFRENFSDFIEKYPLCDMYSSAFYPFSTEEERWAYWARHISVNRYDPPALPLYRNLRELAERKPHFVITTNVDHQFYKAGFTGERIFAVQGDYGLRQCAKGCHDILYDNEQLVKRLRASAVNCMVPTELVPLCPVCGGRMDVNLRKDERFVEDENWHMASERYVRFIRKLSGKRVVFLELGAGFNTPGIIRYPFEQMAYRCEASTLIRLNRDHPEGFAENKKRTVGFAENMAEVLDGL